jgi:hypothetical protein
MPENYNLMQLNIIQPGSVSEFYLANVIFRKIRQLKIKSDV